MKIIISGGGTGGHIFPAISIANATRKRWPECEILFVGAEDRMEMEVQARPGAERRGDGAGARRRIQYRGTACGRVRQEELAEECLCRQQVAQEHAKSAKNCE